MIVPRGTQPDPIRTVRPLPVRRYIGDALRSGIKVVHRVCVTAENSHVHPGTFEGLDLQTGRRRAKPQPELRAQCRFPSGSVRAVTVYPKVLRGDLFWVREGSQLREQSQLTIQITQVEVARLQDMSEAAAAYEGAGCIPIVRKLLRSEQSCSDRRVNFAYHWDRLSSGRLPKWADNPWVWIYAFIPHRRNVDSLLREWRL